MTKAQKKVSIELNIRAIQIENLTDQLDVLILWKRGKCSQINLKDPYRYKQY